MQYEETGSKTGTSSSVKKQATKNKLEDISTATIILSLVKRHKFGLVTIWAVVISIFYFAPFVPDMLFGLIGR